MARVVAYVSFATGWTRAYILHGLTWGELVDTYAYAVDWLQLHAVASFPYLTPAKKQVQVEPNGIDWMMKNNPTVIHNG